MADAENDHRALYDAIANQMGPHRCNHANACTDIASAFRLLGKTISKGDQAAGEARGCDRLEQSDVGFDAAKIVPRPRRPDYSPHSGGGSGLSVPQDDSHRFIAP